MIKLINNEFSKIKRSKIIFTWFLLIITLILMNKYSDRSIYDLSFILIPFIGIIVCIMYSGTICKEIENGTLRFYLTKPYKRWKVYLSKVLSMIIDIILTITIICVVSSIIGDYLDFHYIGKFFVYSIPVLFIGIFCICLSVIFKSSVFVSCFSILTLCFSLILSQTLFGFSINFIEYTFLPYLDFNIFLDKINIIYTNSTYDINLNIIN